MKNLLISIATVFVVVLLVPSVVTAISNNVGKYVALNDELPVMIWASQTEAKNTSEEEQADITTHSETKKQAAADEYIDFEDYIKGVVAAEMPITFSIEALKAQAVAARTYALKKMQAANISDPMLIDGQAYVDIQTLKKIWGSNFETYLEKLTLAVTSTKGKTMTFDGALIEAVFHSTSTGITEASQNVWSNALPYLVSVQSSQDENAPDFVFEQSFSADDIYKKLETLDIDFEAGDEHFLFQTEILERSEAGYILKIKVGNTIFKGTQFRQALGLRSSNFEISEGADSNIIFTTKGYGHGVGMSQYGADFLARQGKSYIDILKTYYQGVEIR